MAEYLESIIVEYYNTVTWVDISAYVVGDITGNNGLGGWKPDQRVGILGTLNITLNNKEKLFSPMGGDQIRGLDTLAGFNKGAKIRIRGPYNGRNDVIWTGRIASIDSDDKNWGNEQTRVMAVDWMQIPANYPMKGSTIALNQRIDQTMALILARLSLQPEATDFETGQFTFPAIFDNVQRKTMAMSEFTKLANSELSYIYVNPDGTLVAENMLTRQGWRALDQVWTMPDEDHFLLMEDGNFLLTEDGGKIILDEGAYEDADVSAKSEEYNIMLGESDFFNASIIRAYPVITDTSLKVLYSLGTPLFIPAGQTVSFSAHYTDPSGLSQVSGTNMQVPSSGTDYSANTKADGTGVSKTINQTVTATYYGDIVYYSITNGATDGIWIIKLQARGYGIYYGNSIESTQEDIPYQNYYGYSPFQFDMKYQKDAYLADMYGKSIVDEYKIPKSRITTMKYLANLNKKHMMSFLTLMIGALILGTEDRSGISNYYYITDRSFRIKQGGIINVEYGVKQNDSFSSGGLVPVTIEFAGTTATDAIGYGTLPHVINLTQRSFSFWIYPDTYSVGGDGDTIISIASPSGGEIVYLSSNKIVYIRGFNTSGVWTADPPSLNAWSHVAITYDQSSVSNDPVIYINGVSVAVTEFTTPVGTALSEYGGVLDIGNSSLLSTPYGGCLNGKLFDPRIYNRILSASEIVALYNSGTPDETLVTDGLVFQGFAMYYDRQLPTGHTTLSSSIPITENIIRAVGIPHGAPVVRSNP
jgi:hypothetical protein